MSDPPTTAEPVEVVPESMAHGGDAVARVDGKTAFVVGALPGDRVLAIPIEDRGRWMRMQVAAVIEPGPARVEPRCRHFGTCGGCAWQHADYDAQLRWKRDIVAGQLAHLGRLDDPPVTDTVAPGPPYGARNRMDYTVVQGRPALYRRRTRTPVPLSECPILEPRLEALFDRLGDLEGVRGITLRAGTGPDDLLAIVHGRVPPQAPTWSCRVARRGGGRRVAGVIGPPFVNFTIAGARFRVTGMGFFQNHTAGAEKLVELVTAALEPEATDVLLDAYCGVGLFAATVGRDCASVVAVDQARGAIEDARHNLGSRSRVEVIRSDVGAYLAGPGAERRFDVAVVDPPRTGLGDAVISGLVAARPRRLGYVSCDPASLARDTARLVEHGYRLEQATPVDLFPQTPHVETVARFAIA